MSVATKLSREVHETIEQLSRFITKRVPEAKSLLSKLYMVSNENLAKAGIEDQNVTAKMANKFMHCHMTILRTNTCATTLNQTMDSMRENFSWIIEMGMPSSFLEDESVNTVEQIAEKIEEKEQDPTAFKSFSQPPTVVDIECVIHPIAWLLLQCESGASLPKVLPYKEMLNLSEAQENIPDVLRPSEADLLLL